MYSNDGFSVLYLYCKGKYTGQIKLGIKLLTCYFYKICAAGKMKHYHQVNSFCKLCTLEDRNNSLCIQQCQALSQTTLKMKVV